MSLIDDALSSPTATDAPMSVVDVTASNAQAVLIEASMERPVIAVFWMPSDEKSQVLRTQLTALAESAEGQWLMASLNVADMGPIAQQLGIQQVPTVMVMKQGQPVDGIVGEQSEVQLQEFLDKHVPPRWLAQLSTLKAALATGDAAETLPALRQIYQESSQSPEVAKVLAEALLALHRNDEAESILSGVSMVDHDAYYEQLMATLNLQKNAADSPHLQALQASLQSEPDNLSLKMQIAVQLFEEKQCEKALEYLMDILRVDMNFDEGAAKKTFLDIVSAMGKGDPTAMRFQRQFFTLMY